MVRKVADDAAEQKVLDDIAKFGWHCVSVLAEADHVPYCFSVGLFHTFGHPELAMFGLTSDIAHDVITIMADAAKAGKPFNLSLPTNALINHYSCCFAEIPAKEYYEHLGFARWFYEGDNFPAFQIIWPSRDGYFPWHPSASPEFKHAQPVIAAGALGT